MSGAESSEHPTTPTDRSTAVSTEPRTSGPRGAALTLRGVTLGYGEHAVVGPVDLEIPAGQTTAIIGANGCGKSTLLRGLTRQLPLRSGTVEVLGRSVEGWPSRDYARTVALLPQSPVAPEGMTVEQLVDRGRHPHRGWFGASSRTDTEAVAHALALTDLVELAGRDVAELSGGQRQRAWLALVLAQQTPVVLLDEPTSYLDLSHQVELMDLVRSLPDPTASGTGRRATVVAVLHELNLAARTADHVIAVAGGRVAGAGTPSQVLTPPLLREVFGLDADVVQDPLLGHPVVLPRTAADRAAAREQGLLTDPAPAPAPAPREDLP